MATASRTAKLTSAALAAMCCLTPTLRAEIVQTQEHEIEITVLSEALRRPWGMAFLPDGDLLVTELEGRLLIVRNVGQAQRRRGREDRGGASVPRASPPREVQEIAGLPDMDDVGQGGLMGIALHPAFETNGWVYLSYAASGAGGYGTEVIRGRLQESALEGVETIFAALPKSRGGRHFGSRLVFAADGTLYISLGERGASAAAQDLDDHRGSLIRINDDGSVPSDNPFVGRPNARPEIYTYGNRNVQGMAVNPDTGVIWTHEHGPQGGDEINIMRPGANYGWPVITYGVNYGIGTKIGEGTHKAGMEQPIHIWVPSIAPSGMTFYTGLEFPNWRGDLFVGSLKFGLLVRLQLDGNRISNEERLLNNRYGRVRDVIEGPDGYIYVLTEGSGGQLLRITPHNPGAL